MLFRSFRLFGIGIAIQTLCVSLPNVSKKDVKGLLFRKQPLHTSPNRSKKGDEGAALLSSLGNLTSPPRRLERVKEQSECSKPERFDELALALLSDTINVLLAEVKSVAPIDTKSKLERRACFVSFCGIFLKLQTFSL